MSKSLNDLASQMDAFKACNHAELYEQHVVRSLLVAVMTLMVSFVFEDQAVNTMNVRS